MDAESSEMLQQEASDAALEVTADVVSEPDVTSFDVVVDASTDSSRPIDATPIAARSARIVVLSDLNGSYGSTTYGSSVHAAVTALVERIRPDLVLVAGDLVAGQRAGLDYRAMWRGFHSAVTDRLTAAGIPVAVTPGNHDASGYRAYAEERRIFVDEWSAPGRVPAVEFVDRSNYPLRYSFVHRGVFVLSLDATTVGPISAEQRAWVDAQLALAERYPVRIAFGHMPPSPIAEGVETEMLADSALEAVFARRGLSVYFSGHQHAYYPGARGGVRLVTLACLGAGPRALLGTSSVAPRSLVTVEVRDDAIRSLEALLAPEFARPVARGSLPTELVFGAHRLVRDDLAGF